MRWRRGALGDGFFGARPSVLGLPLTGRGDVVLGALGDGKAHVPHHRLLALAHLLVVMVGLVHLVLEVLLEAKGLLEASGDLGEEAFGLDGVGHKVRVITIGFLLLGVLGSILTIPWRIMLLDKRALLLR
jgi:hypothetical protein